MLDLLPADEVSPLRGWLLLDSAVFVQIAGQVAPAAEMLAEAIRLAAACGDRRLEAAALWMAGSVSGSSGDYERGQRLVEQALALAVEVGDEYTEQVALNYLGALALRRGELDLAGQRMEDSRVLAERIGDRQRLAHVWSRLGMLQLRGGDLASARASMARGLAYWLEIDTPGGIAQGLEDLAQVAVAAGQERRALRLLGAAAAIRGDVGWRGTNSYPFHAHGLADRVGAGRADPAWAEGNAMRRDEAVALAFEAETPSRAGSRP
jgi:ATP/maltotriose-dependent transcriptional regulator MalT